MSLHIPDRTLASSSLWMQDGYHESQELAESEDFSGEDLMQEQAVQEIKEPKSREKDVQEPSEADHVSEEPLVVPAGLMVTIASRESALLSSRTASLLQPQSPPYEWSFWTDACLRGPKPHKLAGCGFSVVHRRLDNSKPGDRNFFNIWWQSCFVARNVHQIGHAEMFAVAQALAMAVDQCERNSGTAVTKAKVMKPGAAEELKRRAATIPWPMPKVVNIFTDSQPSLNSLDACWLSSGFTPGGRSPMRRANEMIEALNHLGVRVHLQWVPGHAGDFQNRFAHEGARNALNPKHHGRKVHTKKIHRVHRRPTKDRSVAEASMTTTERET